MQNPNVVIDLQLATYGKGTQASFAVPKVMNHADLEAKQLQTDGTSSTNEETPLATYHVQRKQRQ